MMRKMFHILLSFLTSTVLLGHALVYHPHDEAHQRHEHGHHHHNGGHHHTEGEEDFGLKHLFTHHVHFCDTFTENPTGKTLVQVAKSFATVTTSYSDYAVAIPYVHQGVKEKYREPIIQKSPHLVHLDFRGPPTCAVA